ncbi:MAG TPA: ferrous iron transport protein B [Gemmatimonadaceae bacterium]|nr:ferrous iron transport protein B [Gemmatimonadaceae bacterium]
MTAAAGPVPAPPPRPATRPLRVALVGNPNCGKSTLFNALTGRRQRVANFPGVTVERAEGEYRTENGAVEVVDLPGTYSLSPESPDEAIALDVLLGRATGVPPLDVIVIVADAENLERNLYLATEVLELGRPTVIALNRVDRLERAGLQIDVVELIHELGVVVVPVVATRGEGIDRLRHAIDRAVSLPRPALALDESGEAAAAPDSAHAAADREAQRRYRWIARVAERTITRRAPRAASWSDRVDAVVLHKVWGPLIFLGLMLLVFQAMFSWAQPLADGIQALVALTGAGVRAAIPPGELRSLIVDGALGGVGSVLVFLPQIAILFLFIGILEDSGYMARAAFVMDRYMRPLGLHGKSFIPLISGYACAVPAIMSTRTIQQPKERLATIMVVPLMSCSARLPVYTLLVAAFVPAVAVGGVLSLQGLTMLGMYLMGTVAALLAAAVFRRTLLRSETRALIIELPPYAVPSLRVLGNSVWQRVRLFLRRAGTVIFSISILLWGLATYPRATPVDGRPVTQEQQLSQSALGTLGHAIAPAVRPLGYDWKIGVSMVASFAAREVFVSTMGTIYGVGHEGDDTKALGQRLRQERDPVTGRPAYTPLMAIGLMAFYVFALMCTSTVTMTHKETGGGWTGARWAALQFTYMLVLAYGAAFLIYHGGLALGFGGGA